MEVEYIKPKCKYYELCGGCQLQHLNPYGQKLYKEDLVKKLLGDFGEVQAIISMDDPYYYRNKMTRTFQLNKKNKIISGMYMQNTHRVIDMDKCLIENPIGEKITATIKNIAKKYKMEVYDEDKKTGFLRHVIVKTAHKTGEVMVVLVAADRIFPGKKNFIKILRKKHPEITTIVLNINPRDTSIVLGPYEEVMYGPGFIIDELCGVRFRISAKSFYQVNPKQTEILYSKALEMADLSGKEIAIDAYCGIGTIGLIASSLVHEVIGVELNQDAVFDAIKNSKINNIKNTYFYNEDASLFMERLASENKNIDLVVMDPPRSGSDEVFLNALVKLSPEKIIYISCNPETQKRDLEYLTSNNYSVKAIQPVDMFPQTTHVETIVLMSRK